MIQNLGGRIVNNWLYRYADGYVLIDTGYENGYKHFCKQLKKKGIAPQDIHYLFLTHAHDDHAGFLNELLAAIPNLTVIADEKALDVLRKGQNPFTGGCTGRQALTFCKVMALLGKGDHLFPPLKKEYENRLILISDENVHDLDKVLGGKIIRTPGHTADSMSLLLNDGTMFCGDAAMNGFPSVNNVTIWAEDMRDFACSWEKIITLKPKKIYPGHGKPFSVSALQKNLAKLNKVKLYSLEQRN